MIPRLLFLVAAVVGLAVSALLAVEHVRLGVGGGFCGEGGGCAVVLASKWAKVYGVPLAYLGVGFYSVALGVGVWALGMGGRLSGWVMVGLGVGGVVASGVFVGIQLIAIRAICPLCMTSAGCTVVMVGSAVWGWRRKTEVVGWPRMVVGLVAGVVPVVGVVTVLGLMGGGGGGERGGELLGRFEGREIRWRDLEGDDPEAAQELAEEGYRVRMVYLERKFNGLAIQAEARKRGMTREALITAEVDEKVAGEREGLLAKAKELSPDDAERAGKIAENMFAEVRGARLNEWLAGLRAGHKTEVVVKAPLGRKVELDPKLMAEGFREGAQSALLEVVVFSDLQCPVCAELDGVLGEMGKRFGSELAVTFRHFPLSGHEWAEEAAVVGEGVRREGKSFGEYKRAIYAHRGQIDREKIEAAGVGVGLTVEQVRGMREDAALVERVRASAAEARRLRLGGAPVVIVNGRVIGGLFEADVLEGKLREAKARRAEWGAGVGVGGVGGEGK